MRVTLSPLVKSSRSVPLPSSPVTSTSLRSQPVTTTVPAVFEISTVPAGSAAVRLLIGVPASRERQDQRREQRDGVRATNGGGDHGLHNCILSPVGDAGSFAGVFTGAFSRLLVNWLTFASTASSSW